MLVAQLDQPARNLVNEGFLQLHRNNIIESRAINQSVHDFMKNRYAHSTLSGAGINRNLALVILPALPITLMQASGNWAIRDNDRLPIEEVGLLTGHLDPSLRGTPSPAGAYPSSRTGSLPWCGHAANGPGGASVAGTSRPVRPNGTRPDVTSRCGSR